MSIDFQSDRQTASVRAWHLLPPARRALTSRGDPELPSPLRRLCTHPLAWTLATLILGTPAFAQTGFNLNGQALVFAGSGTGSGTTVGSFRTYTNIVTIGGQQINGKITLTELNGATMSAFDSTANPYAETNFFQPNLTIGTVGGYATFTIDFTDTSGNPVSLSNLYLNTYDLDGSGSSASGRQFTDFQGFDSYNLSTTTQITVKTVGGYTRFVTTVGGNRTDTIGSTTFNDIRARVFFSTPRTSVTLRVGDEGATGLAYYAIDPAVGYTFSNASASLSTTKSLATVNGSAYVPGSPIKSGDVLGYQLEVRETGLAAGGSTTLTETVPALTTYSGSSEGWTVSSGSYTQSVTVAAGGTVTKTFTVTVGTLADNDTSISNTVTSGTGTCAVCTVTTTTVPRLRITKTPPASLPAGGTAVYTIGLSNVGGSATSSTVTFTDTLPSGLTFNAQTAGAASMSCSGPSGTITCTGTPAIAAGGSLTVAYRVNVSGSASGTLVNAVLLTARGGDVRTPADNAATPTAGNGTQGSDGLSAKAAQTVATAVQAVTESGTAAAGTASTAIANVRSNDLAYGATATGANSTIATSGSWPAGMTLDTTTGAVNVSAAVAAGTYTVTYQLCDLATPTPNCTTVADEITVQPADLTVAKSHTGSFTQGGTASFSIVVTNSGTGVTSGTVTATDTLPTGLTPTSAAGTGWSCNISGQVVTCTRSDVLAASSSYPSIAVGVSIAANAAVSITNTASVSGGGQSNAANDTGSDTVTVGTVADLTVAKSHGGAFTPGSTGSYSITVTNAGAGATSGTVTVIDTVPAGLTPTSATGTGWGCGIASQVVTCTRSDALAAAASYGVITLGVSIAGSASGSLTNTASVSGGGQVDTSNDTGSDSVTIGTVADLTVATSHSGGFTPGGTGSYTVTVTNAGAGNTSGTVTVTDTVPSGLTPTSAAGTGWSCGIASQVVTCARSDALVASASYPAITVGVSIASGASGSVTNTASVSGGGELNTSNNTGSDTLTVGTGPDLVITSTHSGTLRRGGTTAFTLVVRNVGGTPSSGTVTVSDTLPAGLVPTAASGTGWSCGIASQVVTCTRSDALAASASFAAITVNAQVDASVGTSVTNAASVGNAGDVNASNNSASEPVQVDSSPDLVLSKSHTGNFRRGDTGVFTLVVRNTGGSSTSGAATVTDTLPTGLAAAAAEGDGWTCQVAPTRVTCTHAGTVAAGASYPAIRLTVNTALDAPDSVDNRAGVSGGGETDTSNNSATDRVTVVGLADLVIRLTHVGNIEIFKTGEYEAIVSNIGDIRTASRVAVDDALPPGLTPSSASGTGWTCQVATRNVNCVRHDVLDAGASFPPIRILVAVGMDAADVVTNTAMVSTDAREADKSNNSAEDSAVLVLPPPVELALVKAGDRASAEVGDVMTYRVTALNPSGQVPVDASLVDTLPPGLHYVAGTTRLIAGVSEVRVLEPTVEGAALVFPVGVIRPGTSVEVRYRARIGADVRAGTATNTVSGVTTFRGHSHVGTQSARAAVMVTRGILSMRQFITGRVFDDVNGNGRFDGGDRPLPNARVYLVNGLSVTTDSAGLYNVPSLDEGALVLGVDPASLPAGYVPSAGRNRQGESWTRLLRTPLGGGALLTQHFGFRQIDASGAPSAVPPVDGSLVHAPAAAVSRGQAGDVPSPGLSGDARRGSDLTVVPEASVVTAGGRTSTFVRISVPPDERAVREILVRTSLGHFAADCDSASPALRSCGGAGVGQGAPALPASVSRTSLLNTVATPGVPSGNLPGQDEADARARAGNTPVGVALPSTDPGGAQHGEGFTQALVPVVNGEAIVRLVSAPTAGVARVQAELTGSGERRVGEADVVFAPEVRIPLLVAHGEVAIGRAAPEFALFGQDGQVHGRAGVFLHRNVFGTGALTAAFSSQRTLNEASGVRRMFQLDPLDRVYPVFGDSSTRYETAQSNARLYVRVDKGRSHFLFGDLRASASAPSDQVRLTEFSRNLTGARLHVESTGGRMVEVTAARPDTAFAREVFPGDAAGIVRLSNPLVLPGSEVVVVETRDRRNPEVVVARETLVRSVDYSLDWSTGVVLLLRGLAALDRSLNLVQLVCTYEYQVAGLSSNVVSVRGTTDVPALRMRVGGSLLRQREGSAAPYSLQGFQARVALPQAGHLLVDLPVSHGTVPMAGAGTAQAPADAGATGAAVRVELEQPVRAFNGRFAASLSRTDRSFFNPFGVTTLPGSQNLRAALTLRPRSQSRLLFSAGDERNRTDLVDNQRLSTGVEWTEDLSRAVALGLGYSHRRLEDHARVLDISSHLVQASLTWQPTSRASVLVRREQNLGTADLTYPTQTVLNGRYRLTDQTRLSFAQRLGSAPIIPLGDTRNTGFASLATRSETSVGLESTVRNATALATRYQIENGINGTDSFALVGVMNRLPVRKDLSIDLGVEHGFHLTGQGSSFNSATTGAGWTPGNRLRVTTRVELRDRDGRGSIVSGGVAGRLVDGVTAVSSLQHSQASYAGRETSATQATAGLALRPRTSDRSGLLVSYTLRRSDVPAWDRSPGQFERIGLTSMDGFVRPVGPIELFGKFAVSQRASGEGAASAVATDTYLTQGRIQARFSRYFDTALEGRHVVQPATDTRGSSAGAELGTWFVPDVRVGVGYNFRGNDAIGLNFLAEPVRRGFYLVVSAKLSSKFDLFGTSARTPCCQPR